MDKAEKFIQNYARNCSNECWDVEGSYHPWLSIDEARKAVEIAKEEVIEKACEWLLKNVTYTHPRKGTKECIVNIPIFKQAMKDG